MNWTHRPSDTPPLGPDECKTRQSAIIFNVSNTGTRLYRSDPDERQYDESSSHLPARGAHALVSRHRFRRCRNHDHRLHLGRLDDGGECQNYASSGGEQWPDVCPSAPLCRAIHSHGRRHGQIQDKQRLCQGKSRQRGREKRCLHENGLPFGQGLREQHRSATRKDGDEELNGPRVARRAERHGGLTDSIANEASRHRSEPFGGLGHGRRPP